MRLRLVPEGTNFDFFRFARITFGASVLAMALSVLAYFAFGLNFGIDFRGGTTIRTDSVIEVDVAAYRAAIDPLDLGDVSIAPVFDTSFADDQFVAQVRIQVQEGAESVPPEVIAAVEEALGRVVGGTLQINVTGATLDETDLTEAFSTVAAPTEVAQTDDGLRFDFPADLEQGSVSALMAAATGSGAANEVTFGYSGITFPATESVGPKVSGELIQSAILAVLGALTAIVIYIWLRFEWQFSVGAVAALIHDVTLTIGLFALLQIRFDLAIVAAILTIVGYSINDTVVVFDRARENLRKYKKKPLVEVLNLSANETLSRTLMTSVTTLLALIALLVLGGDVIRGFVFAITWGIIVGTYSSIYVAKNVVLMLGVKRDWSNDKKPTGNQFADIDA